jgi:hypothetical protein
VVLKLLVEPVACTLAMHKEGQVRWAKAEMALQAPEVLAAAGGYYGGGGGSWSGGGGGSSYSSGTSTTHTQGVRSGNGQILLSWNAASSGCTSATRTAVTVTVAPLAAPTPATATPTSVCAGGTSQLNATSTGNNIYWYTVPSGGANIGD